MKDDLVIAHRVCPVLSKTACGFTDKYSMVKACAESMFKALDGINYRLVVILDGCGDEYVPLFPGAEIIRTDSIGNRATFGMQIDILSAVEESVCVYCSEDDYLYAPHAFKAMMSMLRHPKEKVDFVTPIDHPDLYIDVHPESKRVKLTVEEHCHWRECGTTCCTFMTRAGTLQKTKRTLLSYANAASDGAMWLGLTKENVFSFRHTVIAVCRYALGLRKSFAEYLPLEAWRRHGLRLLLTKRYSLWSPLPTLAVHCCKASLPPGAEMFVSGTTAEEFKKISRTYLGLCTCAT